MHCNIDIPETMAKHVHDLQQWFYTQLPRKVIKLSEKKGRHGNLSYVIINCIVQSFYISIHHLAESCKHTGIRHHLRRENVHNVRNTITAVSTPRSYTIFEHTAFSLTWELIAYLRYDKIRGLGEGPIIACSIRASGRHKRNLEKTIRSLVWREIIAVMVSVCHLTCKVEIVPRCSLWEVLLDVNGPLVVAPSFFPSL